MADEIKGLRSIAEIKRSPLIVEDSELLLDSGKFEQLQRVASVMAACDTMPGHIKGHLSDAFRVAEQAFRWGLSPFAVAEKTFFVGGRLAYEGQLIAAVVNLRAGLEAPLEYEFHNRGGKPEALSVSVIGRFIGEEKDRVVDVEWKTGWGMAKGAKDLWLKQPEQQLSYFAARVWARRYAPHTILGCYTDDEIKSEQRSHIIDITPTEEDQPQDKLSKMERTLRRAKEGVGVVRPSEVKLEDIGQNSGQEPEEQHHAGKFYKDDDNDDNEDQRSA